MSSSVDTHRSDDPESGTELKRHVGLVGLLFASVGSIIGSGWLFGAMNAAREEIENFGRQVIPLVRELEEELDSGRGAA